MLRNICAPKREEITGDWRRVYIEDLHGLYSSPLYDQIKKRAAGHVERMGKSERYAETGWGNQKERDQVEDLGIYKTI
jgi:hypothetical protein